LIPLRFSGTTDVDAPLTDVWLRLTDPHFMARHAPTSATVRVVDERRFAVTGGFGAGTMRLEFTIDVEITDLDPPSHLTMKAHGKGFGSALDVSAALALDPVNPELTRLDWSAETGVGGPIAGVAAPLMEGIGKKLAEQFWKRVAEAIKGEVQAANA